MESPSARVERLSSELSRTVAAQLEQIRECYREGRRREAYERVQTLRQEESWDILESSLQARILRILATYALNLDGDASLARDLADMARSLDPSSDDTVFRTLLKYHTEGAESALREVGHPGTLDTINLEVSLLLLGLGKTDEALAKLANLPQGLEPNAETRRLHALALLTKGDLAGARTHIQLALDERPKWEDIRIAGAIINYFSALAPTVIPNHIVPWPPPVDWSFVRRDNQSLERLRQAKSEFETLTIHTNNDEDRKLFEVWCLACLANDPDRQTEAQEFCRHLLEQVPINHRVVVWAVARNYAVDLQVSEKALEEMLGDNEDGLS
jgi:tetratricopeptide (TPR) repeat protein